MQFPKGLEETDQVLLDEVVNLVDSGGFENHNGSTPHPIAPANASPCELSTEDYSCHRQHSIKDSRQGSMKVTHCLDNACAARLEARVCFDGTQYK
jgi:hypothetical protein